MKPFEFNRLTVLFASFLTLFAFGTAFAQWQPDVRLTYDGSNSVTSWSNARSVAAYGDTVHVVWVDERDGNKEVYYKRSTDNGAIWGLLDTRLTEDTCSSHYPSVAVSGPTVIAVWIDGRDTTPKWPKVFYKRSTDYGQTWGADALLSDDSSCADHPSVTFSGSVVQAVWTDNRDGDIEIYTKRSTDNGATWGLMDTRLTSDSCTSDDPSTAVSGSYVHVVWRDQRVGLHDEIYYKRSTTSGTTWGNDTLLSIGDTYSSSSPSISVSGSVVHVVWFDARDANYEIYYRRSLDNGATWGPVTRLTYNTDISYYPSISAYGSAVAVAWYDDAAHHIFSKRSTDNGTTWSPDTRLTTESIQNASCQSVSITANTAHLVWFHTRDGNLEIYYKRRLDSGGFDGFLTEPSQGRHLVRDPSRNVLHLVMKSEQKDSVYYLRSTDNGDSWSVPLLLGAGQYPTVGLAVLPEDVYPPYIAVCVAYEPPMPPYRLIYHWNDNYENPGGGDPSHWHRDSIPTSVSGYGPPSLVTFGGTRVYVAYPASQPGPIIFCDDFLYNNPSGFTRDTIDWGNPSSPVREQPSLAVDGGGLTVHATWKRGSEIYYCARDTNGNWPDSMKLRVDQTSDPSQQPFIECYGDRVYVVWSDDQPLYPNDVWRAWKYLAYRQWENRTDVSNSSDSSVSPTQAFGEFTTWSEGRADPKMFDIKYWSPAWDSGIVEPNPATWSSWTHSQMAYVGYPFGFDLGADLWSAWTESPNPGLPPFTVLTKKLTFYPPLGGGGDGFGSYYSVQAGQDSPSPYCRKRDGALKFKDRSVDFSRDSLVYELPYLDPQYDYYVKMNSYREAGVNWSEAISLDGMVLRMVQFAPNKVDTAWLKVPWELYKKDRKVTFVAKKVSGDYVTRLGMTLYQVDPKRGKGGPQAGEAVGLPVKEVFAVYPNPVTSQARIEYSLRTSGQVNLSVYDVTGRMVREVVNGHQPAGVYKTLWDGLGQNGRLASTGVYFVKLNVPGKTKTARVVLVR